MRNVLFATALVIILAACQGKVPETAKPAEIQAAPPSDQLNDRIKQCRAVEAVIWGMPAVNTDLMYQAMANQAHGTYNQIVFWSHFPDWKNQTLTPNPNAIYLMPFINTRDAGPIVLEIPPASSDGSIIGNLDDVWQVALEDIGPAGADKGKGGKYLILPPGYKQKIPAGCLPMPSDTYENYALVRFIPASGSEADVAKALAYGKRVKIYPLLQAANPPATTFVDATNVMFDSTIPYDVRYFESLNRIVQIEPWLERDEVMIDQLKSIGIEKVSLSILMCRCRTRSSKLQRKPTNGSTSDMSQSSFPISRAPIARSTCRLRSRAWISRLNTRPVRPPVNASKPPSRAAPHDSGPLWFAIPSTYETFIHYTLPV